MDELLEYAEPEAEEENPLAILIAGELAARSHPGLPPRYLIRCLRRGAGLSQRALARRADMQQSRVSEIELARVEPRWGEIRDLLAAMGCEPVLLATGKDFRAKITKEGWEE